MKLTQQKASIKKTIITTALAGLFVLTATPTTAITGLSVDAFAATTAAQTAFKQTQAHPTQPQQVKEVAYHIVVNGTDVTSQVTSVAPILNVSNRTMLPLRPLANALGVADTAIKWEAEYKTASLSKDSTTVEVVQEHDHLIVNGAQAQDALDAKALNYNNRLYLPTRAIGEALNCTIGWDATTKTVKITTGSGSGSQQQRESIDVGAERAAAKYKSEIIIPAEYENTYYAEIYAGLRSGGATREQALATLAHTKSFMPKAKDGDKVYPDGYTDEQASYLQMVRRAKKADMAALPAIAGIDPSTVKGEYVGQPFTDAAGHPELDCHGWYYSPDGNWAFDAGLYYGAQ